MPSAVRKQNSESASHETAWTLDEVSNSALERPVVANENIIVSGDTAGKEVASLGVDDSADLSPVEASNTAASACCRAAQSCVATPNGRDCKPDDTVADIEMAEMLTAADDAHATEHSENTRNNSMDGDLFRDNVGDRNYRPRSIFPPSPHMPRGEPSGCGNAINGRRDELAQQDDGCPPERLCSQRPAGKDSTAIDMSGIDEPSRDDERLAANQNANDAVPIVTGADEASTNQDDSSAHYDAGMPSHAPKAKQQRKHFVLSPDGKAISEIIRFRPSKSEIELLANAADTLAKEKQRESDKFQRKLNKRAAKRNPVLPVSESIPGYVGDKDIDFCLSYVTGIKVNPSCESVNRVNDGGRLKNKMKKKGKRSTSSTPEECSSSVSHPTATTAPEEISLHRPATGNTASAGASVLAASALSFNEGSIAGSSSRPAAGAGQFAFVVAPRYEAFQVVDRKKKVKNPVSSTASQPVRMPLRVLPARDVPPPVITFGSCTSNAASTCTDDDRSEGDGASTPTSCTNQPLGSSEMDAGDGCTSLGSPPLPQEQPTTHGPSVPAKAELPKATWAAVAAAAAARNRVCDTPATIACHATGTNDQSFGPQKMVTGDDSADDPGAGSPPRGCAAAVEVATVASCETADYQPPAAGLQTTVVQWSSTVSWPNAVVNPGILADSSQKKSSPPERGPDSYCDRVRPVGEEAARAGESCAVTSSAKIAPVVALTSRSTPAGGRKMDVSSALPEVSLQRSKGVEFVGNQWREFFLRDAPRRIAFGFHDPLSSAGGRSTAESDNTGRLLQVSSIISAACRPSDDTPALDGADLVKAAVRAACLASSVPVSVPAEEGAAAAAVCMPANVCDNRSQGNDLFANAEPRRLPASFTLGMSGSSTNVNTPECSSDYSASYLATVAYLSTRWQAVQELLLTDASRVQVYGDGLNHEKSGSVAETGNGRRV